MGSWRLERLETERNLRRASFAKKPDRKATVADRISLWLSTSRDVDGLWVGSIEFKPAPGLRRVEDALQLIKEHDPLHYSRIINNLERIWIDLLPFAWGLFERSLNACKLDERFVLSEATTLQQIASTIVHEATHARLERWGISYDDEKARSRIEAICLRRELNFAGKLPQAEPLREEIARKLAWCIDDNKYFPNVNLWQETDKGNVETLRHLRTPDWVIRVVLKARAIRTRMRQWIHRFSGFPRRRT
jgi:hypothetical protein